MAERLTAIVRGRVQGVGFRDFVCTHARALGVTGYVRNLPDRSVEVIAEGEPDTLDGLLANLHRGPASAMVSGVTHSRTTSSSRFTSFTIEV